MITGYNTDIEHQGVTYHVQTEDKGLDARLILSLVYDGGTILASKRSPYDDLAGENFDEQELINRLNKQHTLICAAIKSGRIEDLKRMTMKEASKKKGLIAQKEVKVVSEAAPEPEISLAAPETVKEEIPLPDLLKLKPPEFFEEKPVVPQVLEIPVSIIEEPFGVQAVEVVEEVVILPADAVEIITDATRHEPETNVLTIELLNDVTLKGGERKTLSILVNRGRENSGLSGAHVMVKIIGSSFRPLIFHSKTDSNGVAVVHLQLPHFRTGRAAIMVRAMTGGEETELRRVIQQG